MKKDRNSFFSQYGYSSYGNNMMQPNMYMDNYNNMNMGTPYQQQNMNYNENLESRIEKLERENKLLDSRITKLENSFPKITNNTDYNFANSMYMV